jgi:hypothetical protein
MATNITDVDTFTTPLQVPDDGEDADQASLLNTFLQGLANRTRNAKNRLDGMVATIAGTAMIWTQVNRFTAGARAAGLALESGDLLYTDAAGAASPRLLAVSIPLSLEMAAGTWALNDTTKTLDVTGGGTACLKFRLPTGLVVTGFNVGITDQGAAAALVDVFRDDVVTGTGVHTRTSIVSGSWATAGSGAYQVHAFSGGALPHSISNAAREYYMYFGFTGNGKIHFASVDTSDAGFKGNV